MSKRLLLMLVIGICLLLTGYIGYRIYLPKYVASMILEDKSPFYLPEKITKKINKLKTPINQSTEALILSTEKSGIKTEELLQAIEEINEDQVNKFIEELISKEHEHDANKIFDLAKQHFPVSFDVELLRDEFIKQATPQVIRKAMDLSKVYQTEQLISFESGRLILKQMILQKQVELRNRNLIQ